ncbi:MAG: hypothetical protein KDA29_03970 [Phycisphaerales bacterium]|nr:hypothetical protein [Phycisphaerales bacterium]
MPTPKNELCWWIEHNGSTNTATDARQVPKSGMLAMGKVYHDSKSGVIMLINDAPARMELVTSQLLDVLHTRFPSTRWWVKDPTPAHNPSQTQTAS